MTTADARAKGCPRPQQHIRSMAGGTSTIDNATPIWYNWV